MTETPELPAPDDPDIGQDYDNEDEDGDDSVLAERYGDVVEEDTDATS